MSYYKRLIPFLILYLINLSFNFIIINGQCSGESYYNLTYCLFSQSYCLNCLPCWNGGGYFSRSNETFARECAGDTICSQCSTNCRYLFSASNFAASEISQCQGVGGVISQIVDNHTIANASSPANEFVVSLHCPSNGSVLSIKYANLMAGVGTYKVEGCSVRLLEEAGALCDGQTECHFDFTDFYYDVSCFYMDPMYEIELGGFCVHHKYVAYDTAAAIATNDDSGGDKCVPISTFWVTLALSIVIAFVLAWLIAITFFWLYKRFFRRTWMTPHYDNMNNNANTEGHKPNPSAEEEPFNNMPQAHAGLYPTTAPQISRPTSVVDHPKQRQSMSYQHPIGDDGIYVEKLDTLTMGQSLREDRPPSNKMVFQRDSSLPSHRDSTYVDRFSPMLSDGASNRSGGVYGAAMSQAAQSLRPQTSTYSMRSAHSSGGGAGAVSTQHMAHHSNEHSGAQQPTHQSMQQSHNQMFNNPHLGGMMNQPELEDKLVNPLRFQFDDSEDHFSGEDPEDKIPDDIHQLKDVVKIDYRDLIFETEIGRGACGKVFRARWRDNIVAAKRFRKEDVDEKKAEVFVDEMRVFAAASENTHKNVLRLYGYCTNPFCLVTEYMDGGSVKEYLRYEKPESTDISILDRIIIAKQAAEGIAHLHGRHILHRDIAARNLLMKDRDKLPNRELSVVVSDFGMSRILNEDVYAQTYTTVGPLKWMAPEAISDFKYTRKSDVYAFGITLWELLTGQDPYPDIDPVNTAVEVLVKGTRPQLYETIPKDIAKLMRKCWHVDPAKRPTFEEIVKILDDYINQAAREIRELKEMREDDIYYGE